MKPFQIIFFISFFFCSFYKTYGQEESLNLEVENEIEKISQFHADIVVQENGNIIVTETIKVVAANLQVDHGIFRELPMKNYSSKVSRNNFYTVINISKNGSKEPFHTRVNDEKFIIYIGDKDVSLKEGIYTYTITYAVEAQIHSYTDFDEVYWNVTGNFWHFNISAISATVILPKTATVLQTHCYTGILGSTDSDCNSEIKDNSVYFKSKDLKEGEGFTIAVGFPKGIVHQSAFLPHFKMEEFLSPQKIATGLFAVVICFLFYYFSWKTYGQDALYPDKNEEIDLKSKYSATILQYIKERCSNSTTLLTTIISLSIKGAIQIQTNGKENWQDGFEYFLKKKTALAAITPEENSVLENIFKENETFVINSKSYLTFDVAEKELEESLKSQINLKNYFQFNGEQIVLGFIITTITLFGYCYYVKNTILGWPIFGFICLVLSFISIKEFLKLITKKEFRTALVVAFFAIFPTVFCYASFFAYNVDKDYSILNALVLFLIITGFSIYLRLITRYTPLGIKMQHETENLKNELLNFDVISTLDVINSYEENLPYAFALGIQEEWNQKFNLVLKELKYNCNWLKNPNANGMYSTGLLVNFHHTYNATATSSSSGSSGGGSSGGGGGGGGGGGW